MIYLRAPDQDQIGFDLSVAYSERRDPKPILCVREAP